jgi:2'-5' RNA ligase
MRLFIAIPLSAGVRRALADAQRSLKQYCSGGKFVPPENFHITLHFLGETQNIAGAARAVQNAVRDARPFTLRLGKYGAFARGRARTSFIETEGDLVELSRLYETLQSALADEGFARGHRKFTPHITLGRNVEHDALAAQELENCCESVAFTVQEIVLFESRNINGRMVYTPVQRGKF